MAVGVRDNTCGLVVCGKKDECRRSPECGGVTPHIRGSECGHCPYDPSAECVGVTADAQSGGEA